MIDAPAARERCATLRAAGEALAARPVREVVAALAAACGRWADPADPDRRAGEAALAERYAVPREAVARILDAAFPCWDAAALARWIESELGSLAVLDGFVALAGARRRAQGPGLAAFLAARGVPTTPVADVLSALCVKAAIWIKPASGGDDLTARFASTLADVDPEMGAAVETAGWAAGSEVGEVVLGSADVVVATGGEETMAALRGRVAPDTRLVLHGPRISAALVCRESLHAEPEATIAALADDVAFAGQAGCLSPVVAWIEAPAADVEELAVPLAAACAERWPARSRTRASAGERAAWAEWTALAAVEASAEGAGVVAGGPESGWTVRAAPRAGPPDPPPVPRSLVLAPVESAAMVAALCGRRRGRVSTVGIAAPEERVDLLAPPLAAAGVERIAPLGRMQRPPLAWRRDGRPTLGDLVRWVDREG